MNTKYIFVGVLLLLACSSHAGMRKTIARQNRTIDVYADTKASYEQAAAENPVLEIIYAARGLDNEESVYQWEESVDFMRRARAEKSGLTLQHNDQSIAGWKPAIVDVTDEIRAALHQGAVYMQMRTDGNPGVFGSLETTKGTPTDLTTMVVYRDTHGVHVRRFEGWNNIVLPEITSWDHFKNNRGQGGYFYHHQFEEIGRGLITFEVRGTSGLTFLATNRVAEPGKARYDAEKGVFESGVTDLKGYYGPDFCYYPDMKRYLLQFVWGMKEGRGSQLSFNAFPYFDRGKLVSVALPAVPSQDPGLESGARALSFPTVGRDPLSGFMPCWIALDGNRFMCGTGKPTSADDFAADGVTVLYDKACESMPPFLRHFALCNGSTAAQAVEYRNVCSRVLYPAKKFCTPPFSKGRYFFWRPGMQSKTPGKVCVTFKARGNVVMIALSDVRETNPLQYAYAIRLGHTAVITKHNNYAVLGATVYPSDGSLVIDDGGYHPYWVMYNEGLLQVGKGSDVGKNMIASYQDQNPIQKVAAISFSSDLYPVDYCDIVVSDQVVGDAQASVLVPLHTKQEKEAVLQEEQAASVNNFFSTFFAGQEAHSAAAAHEPEAVPPVEQAPEGELP